MSWGYPTHARIASFMDPIHSQSKRAEGSSHPSLACCHQRRNDGLRFGGEAASLAKAVSSLRPRNAFREFPQQIRVSSPTTHNFSSNLLINNYLDKQNSCRLVMVNPI